MLDGVHANHSNAARRLDLPAKGVTMMKRPKAVSSFLLLLGALTLAREARGGSWEAAAPTNVTREYAGLAVMPDGHVLAVTGHPIPGSGKGLASAELYDPLRNEWRPTGSLNVPRGGTQPGALVTLPNGKVLIAGGGSGNRSVHEAELYDYEKGEWTTTGSMETPRCVHTTTQLDDGNVLVCGGIDWITEEVHATAEIYDYKSGRWSKTGSMHTPRFNHRAVKLSDGRVLVAGGIRAYPGEGLVVASAEIYDAKQGTWRETAPMKTARRSLAAVRLKDGRVLVAAGASGASQGKRQLSEAEVFDPRTESWTNVGPMREARWGPTADLLADGKVLVTGGAFSPIGARRSAELFDPETGTWSDAGNLRQARNGHRAINLKDGRILIVGGHYIGRYLADCELYVP
jgi:Galactose oxidase, central domain/Kelch motif